MSKPKFTPGPWVKDGWNIAKPGFTHIPIARTTGHWSPDEDARLIAAAPFLYEMAKQLVDHYFSETNQIQWEDLNELVLALDKAVKTADGRP